MRCSSCNSEIEDAQDGISCHIHHNDITCHYVPVSENEFDDLIHILTCSHIEYYHDNCCPWCLREMADLNVS